MKTNLRRLVLQAALVVAPFGGAFNASARTDVFADVNINSTQDFYEPLGRCGHWVEVENYGRCWYPAYVASDWRPYTSGYWLWTGLTVAFIVALSVPMIPAWNVLRDVGVPLYATLACWVAGLIHLSREPIALRQPEGLARAA